MKRILIIIVIAFLLTSCSNNSDSKAYKMVSSKNTKYKKDIQISINQDDILNNLKPLCIEPRNYRTEGEKKALNYLNNKITSYGYASKTTYHYENKLGKKFTILEQDSRFINPDTYSNFKLFKENHLIN